MNPFSILLVYILVPLIATQQCTGKVLAQRVALKNKSGFTRVSGINLTDIWQVKPANEMSLCAQRCDAASNCAVFEFNKMYNLCVLAASYKIVEENINVHNIFDRAIFAKSKKGSSEIRITQPETCLDRENFNTYFNGSVSKWLYNVSNTTTSGQISTIGTSTTTKDSKLVEETASVTAETQTTVTPSSTSISSHTSTETVSDIPSSIASEFTGGDASVGFSSTTVAPTSASSSSSQSQGSPSVPYTTTVAKEEEEKGEEKEWYNGLRRSGNVTCDDSVCHCGYGKDTELRVMEEPSTYYTGLELVKNKGDWQIRGEITYHPLTINTPTMIYCLPSVRKYTINCLPHEECHCAAPVVVNGTYTAWGSCKNGGSFLNGTSADGTTCTQKNVRICKGHFWCGNDWFPLVHVYCK